MVGPAGREPVVVVGTAIVRHGRVLAARRVAPADVAGGWELPGGKVEPGESLPDAAVREVGEELGCSIEVTGMLSGESAVKPGHVLKVAVATLVSGEPVPHEHDAIRWLDPAELEQVRWLPSDVRFLTELRELLLDGARLYGGNVGGAVRIGRTVRRATGPWTPAVHALLSHLEGFPCVPRVLGSDERGREVLTHMPGRVVDIDTEMLTEGQIVSVTRWVATLHDALRDFSHPGPWRLHDGTLEHGEIICHNDVAPYNICFEGDDLVGVFDWDVSGPNTPLIDLGFLAWNAVPLWRDLAPANAARRLELIASTYGGPTGREILHATVARVEQMIGGISAAQAAGDPGMLNLADIGEPERTRRSLAELRKRIPAIEAELGHGERSTNVGDQPQTGVT